MKRFLSWLSRTNKQKSFGPFLQKRTAFLFAVLLLHQTAQANPALWVARSPGATAYLFGTVHVLPVSLGQAWFDKTIRDALAASSELWTEADIGDLAASVNAIRRYGIEPEGDVATLLPPPYRDRFRREVARSGLPALLVTRARPWFAGMLLEAAAPTHAGAMTLGAEATLLAYAKAHGLATHTFETLDDQFGLMAGMPLPVQIESLEEAIDSFGKSGDDLARLLATWRAGDQGMLDQLTNVEMRSHGEAAWAALILHRNERFAARIGLRLQGRGIVFVAVGAAHMCGGSGVPALLTASGFSVQRVQ